MNKEQFEKIISAQFDEEEVRYPTVHQFNAFQKDPVWKWLEGLLVLDQRQIMAELTQGRRYPTGEQLGEQELHQLQGQFQRIDFIFNLIETVKSEQIRIEDEEKIKLTKNKET